ncbi:MAG: glycosyltransferase family 4 protein [Phycisphaerae bacterium]|nr:glycosyltransferase family 4 protein [Phycisphaerae bacterium]MDW8262795.1 glycosyltransferase family 4 protein [Phycisphaerales bacterium]
MPDRPLRVLHLLTAVDPGGLSRYVIDLANATAAEGNEVVVAADEGAWGERFLGQSFEFVRIPLRRERWLYRRSLAVLSARLADRPPDLIHSHYRRATLLGRRLQRLLVSAQTGAASARSTALPGPRDGVPPILYTVHLSHISLGFPRNLLTDFGDHTHVASEDSRLWCLQQGRVPAERITLIPHGVDTARFHVPTPETRSAARAALQLGESEVVAAFVGRLENPKNESWLIDLAAASRAQLPHLRVFLAGDGPNAPALRQRIDEQNLHDRVRLLGEIDPLPLYHAADALLLPSAREGFSLVCAEAMSCGLPVLRTRTSGTTELILEGQTGCSTPIDRDAFLAAAIPFLSDRSRLRAMGATAAEHVRRNFTFRRQVERTIELYRRLAQRA